MSATGSEISGQVVIVVGAGPAGMAVAKKMSDAGHEVIILNRDIKFGGLAEYGIFPSKLKLRGGLKKQYWEMLEQPNVHYFGNVSVGQGKDLTVEDLHGLGASAIAFSIGAQGTKAIGVEGESAKGVFHAKDVVYHFNRLPGFGDRPFDGNTIRKKFERSVPTWIRTALLKSLLASRNGSRPWGRMPMKSWRA